MASTPDGSQSVWKRTLSAATAWTGPVRHGIATAAISANARDACFIGDLLDPGEVQVAVIVADLRIRATSDRRLAPHRRRAPRRSRSMQLPGQARQTLGQHHEDDREHDDHT